MDQDLIEAGADILCISMVKYWHSDVILPFTHSVNELLYYYSRSHGMKSDGTS